MATLKKIVDNNTITNADIEEDLNFFYIMRPNESLAADKESKITLFELSYLLDSENAYYNSGWFYKAAGEASLYERTDGAHTFFSAISGAADAAITFVETMRTGLSSNNSKILSVGKNSFEAWSTGAVFQLGGKGFHYEDTTQVIWGYNAYYDGAWKYTETDEASRLYQTDAGALVFESADSGTADTAITWKDAFSVDTDGNTNIEGNLTIGGSFGFENYETITSNTTITLEKTDQLRTIILSGTVTEITISKGTGTDESSIARFYNQTGDFVNITDGVSLDFPLETHGSADFYFQGTTLKMRRKSKAFVNTTGNVTYTIPEGQFYTYIIHDGTGSETLTIASPTVTNADVIYEIEVYNRATTSLRILASTGSGDGDIYLTNFQSVIGSFGSDGVLGFFPRNKPKVDGGYIDPRDNFRGFIYASNVTDNTFFDTLSPFIPNIGDPMSLFGSVSDGTILRSVSRAERSTASTITIYTLDKNGNRSAFIANDGGSTTTDEVNISF